MSLTDKQIHDLNNMNVAAQKARLGNILSTGGQADWSQSDETAPDYIENRPFYENLKVYTQLIDILWDGNTEGRVSSSKGHYFKVSDTVLTSEQFIKMIYVYNGGDIVITGNGINSARGVMTYRDGSSAPVIVTQDAVNVGSIQGGAPDTFPEAGVYFPSGVTRLYSTEPIEFNVSEIKKIDMKFIPDVLSNELSKKMDSENPVGFGSFSMGRKPGSVIGHLSHAEGDDTSATGYISHAEGHSSISSGTSSHAEGYGTEAKGDNSHAEGRKTLSSSDSQHVQGKYNIEDTSGTYAHIVGNGSSDTIRSNAHTLDWAGNAWFAGEVEGTALIIKSSTSGSSKRFKITVDDSGTISATEYVE